jgi:superfamily II DNA or RNA helicase
MLVLSKQEKVLCGGDTSIVEDFQAGLWHGLAALLLEGDRATLEGVMLKRVTQQTDERIVVRNSSGDPLFSYSAQGAVLERFLSRFGKQAGVGPDRQRAAVLKRLARYTLSDNERIMLERGFRTRRQSLEESAWFRMAYHAYLEYGNNGCRFKSLVKPSSGEFVLSVADAGGNRLIEFNIPRNRVRALLEWLPKHLPGQSAVALHSTPLEIIYRIRLNEEKDLELTTHYRFSPEKGKPIYYRKDHLEAFRYGDLIYLKDQRLFVMVASPDSRAPRITGEDKLVVKRARVPAFLDQFRPMLTQAPYELDHKVQRLRIFKSFESVTINPEVLRRDWCWLSVTYRFGKSSLGLRDILRAKQEGKRFLETPEGWVDTKAKSLEGLEGVRELPLDERLSDSEAIRLRRMDLFRVQAATEAPLQITGHKDRATLLKQIFSMKPAGKMPPMRGLKSKLRKYQKIGVKWLWYLYDNGFGGLLCDDMGLGKTHQAMALMTCLKAGLSGKSRFLVVCPTTVLSHWEQKIGLHAPCLSAGIYHGGKRNLTAALEENDVLLTSYGILRRDIDALSNTVFTLVVFDEIQNVKNSATLSYAAAEKIQAQMRLGMTGTPIENTLIDLKAVMDLTLPGYLARDQAFRERYINALKDEELEKRRKKELSRLISPFTLRRKKETVLDDLPEKIEDVRTCRLSEIQARLYQEAIELRAEGIISALKDPGAAVPYIHIFALLTLLKQICDHPALVQGVENDFHTQSSGKWELFKELLSESLDSGQKVVVYTQFLGMVRIMEKYLAAQKVGFVTLTGASRKRGEIIRRFNEDSACRVYVGSLKAGGTGVDLIGGSVVIHYDRWWNAAKEDQATDRVHRIGQTRGVQVFKLVTEGTLEEKISAIIMAKRNLMDSIVKEDDPGLLKSFSREDLMEMLALPKGELMMAENGE